MHRQKVKSSQYPTRKNYAKTGAKRGPNGPIPSNLLKTKMLKQFTAPGARLSIRRIAFIKQKIENLSDNSNDFSEKFTGDFLSEFFLTFSIFLEKSHFLSFFQFFWKFTTFCWKKHFFCILFTFFRNFRKKWKKSKKITFSQKNGKLQDVFTLHTRKVT